MEAPLATVSNHHLILASSSLHPSPHPHLILHLTLTSSSCHPHVILTSPGQASLILHLILTSSSPRPHLILTSPRQASLATASLQPLPLSPRSGRTMTSTPLKLTTPTPTHMTMASLQCHRCMNQAPVTLMRAPIVLPGQAPVPPLRGQRSWFLLLRGRWPRERPCHCVMRSCRANSRQANVVYLLQSMST